MTELDGTGITTVFSANSQLDSRPRLVSLLHRHLHQQANAALIRLLAKALGVPRSAVRIASGETARVKVLEIDGLDEAEVRQRLDQ